MLVPADTLASSEGLRDFRFVEIGCLHDVEGAGEKGRRTLFGERHRLLRRERKGVLLGMKVYVSGRGLAGKPLTHIALVQARLLSELGRRDRRAVGHRLVEAETIAEQNTRTGDCGTKIANEL